MRRGPGHQRPLDEHVPNARLDGVLGVGGRVAVLLGVALGRGGVGLFGGAGGHRRGGGRVRRYPVVQLKVHWGIGKEIRPGTGKNIVVSKLCL